MADTGGSSRLCSGGLTQYARSNMHDQPGTLTEALPRVVAIYAEAAQRLGMEVEVLDPIYGHLFAVRDGGRVVTLLGGRSPLNDSVSARLCEDKFFTELLLRRAGIRATVSARCLAPGHFKLEDYRAHEGLAAGVEHAETHGYPVVVKPNRLSHGRGVALVRDKAALSAAIESAWRDDYIALVQNRVVGVDYRLDFLNGEYLIGYARVPIVVHGDGKRSIRELVVACDGRFADDAFWQKAAEDHEWQTQVVGRGFDAKTVLPEGETLSLGGDILNLNRWAGGTVISSLPSRWKDHCLRVGQVMSLRHFGMDIKGATLDGDPADATVIEVNASPLLSQLYRMGHVEMVLEAQMRVLRAIFSRGV